MTDPGKAAKLPAMGWAWVAGAVVLALVAFVYLVVVADGAYFGRRGVRFIYQRMAGGWDYPTNPETRSLDRRELVPLLRDALADRAATPRVLDVATGTGRVPSLLLAEQWFAGEVDGLDLSPNMLAKAAEHLDGDIAAGRVRLTEGDATSLDWPDASFDLVTCIESFVHFPRPRRALGEMVRVLKPGGTLVLHKGSDRHARALPGRAMTAAQLRRALRHLGMDEPRLHPLTRGGGEVAVSRKPSQQLGL